LDLRWAVLNNADLRLARLGHTNLSKADLHGSNLQKADLFQANLASANLASANLTDANLERADLTDVDFRQTDLANTQLKIRWDFKGLNFAKWQGAKGLARLRLSNESDTLSAFRRLQNDFKKAGMRQEERGITAAIRRAQNAQAAVIERIFNWLAFELTCDWGASPSQPLKILFAGLFVFGVPYTMALMYRNPVARGAIWRVWLPDRVLDRDESEIAPKRLRIRPGGVKERISAPAPDGRRAPVDRERLWALPLFQAIPMGLYFSVLSAFHIGWRDLNVGNWIARMQPREYALRPSGWVRFAAGLQSLLSVYLLALAVLTYFGRPFE
jgi:uncharacterized MAPEG superfamily protein